MRYQGDRATLHELIDYSDDQILMIDLGPVDGQALPCISSIGRAHANPGRSVVTYERGVVDNRIVELVSDWSDWSDWSDVRAVRCSEGQGDRSQRQDKEIMNEF